MVRCTICINMDDRIYVVSLFQCAMSVQCTSCVAHAARTHVPGTPADLEAGLHAFPSYQTLQSWSVILSHVRTQQHEYIYGS